MLGMAKGGMIFCKAENPRSGNTSSVACGDSFPSRGSPVYSS
jgi:hypothetical protein